MKILNRKSLVALLAALPLLTSCGGGSSSRIFPVDAVASAVNTSPRTITVTNDDTPDTFVITFDLNPAADAVFEGTSAKTMVYTGTLEENGAVIENAGGTEYFQTGPFRYLGTLYDDGAYEVAANQVNLPKTASIGDAGNFYTSTTYTDNSKTTVEDTAVVRWSLESDPDSDDKAYFCVNEAVPFTNPDDVAKIATCYRINDAGSILGYRVTYTYADGSRLIFD